MPKVGDIILWKKKGKNNFTFIGVLISPYRVRSSRGEFKYPLEKHEYDVIPMSLDFEQRRTLLNSFPPIVAPDYRDSISGPPILKRNNDDAMEQDWDFLRKILYEALHYDVRQWQDLLLRQEQMHTYDETIFVSIPSFRDPQCFDTIRSLWSNATQPHKIFVGVCQQNNEDDQDVGMMVKDMFPSLYENNFFILRVDSGEATGPCLARELIENFLYNNQDFVLMIDSHTLFKADWDTRLVGEWKLTEDPKAILSTYPNEYDSDHSWINQKPTFLKASKWALIGFPLYIQSRYKDAPTKPVPSITIAAGFCFLPREAINASPYVTNVPFSFIGEETVMAIKYFTNGFNLYSPTEDIVETSYNRTERPNFREVVRTLKEEIRDESNRRLMDIACGRIPSELGSERVIEEYYTYSGMNIRNGTLDSFSQYGVAKTDTHESAFAKWGKDMDKIYNRVPICR